jgi:hypothetical protein
VPGASYKTVTGDARPGRILLAEQQVLSIRSADSSTDTSATSCRTSGSQEALLPPGPLRTVRETSASYGSSLVQRPSQDAALPATARAAAADGVRCNRSPPGACRPIRFDADVPLLPGRPWGEFETPRADELYHGVAESHRPGPPPLARTDLHDTHLEQTNPVARVAGRTIEHCCS